MEPALEAQDPNASPEVLLGLLVSQPQAVLANPAFDLLLLELPDLWGRLSEAALRAVAAEPGCPLALVDWGLKVGLPSVVRAQLVLNPALPLEKREQLFCQAAFLGSASPGLAREAGLSERLIQLLVRTRAFEERWQGGDPLVRPDLPAALGPGELAELGGFGELGRLLALEQPGCPQAVVVECARSAPLALRAAAASHARLPREAMGPLARDGAEAVRQGVARNPGASSEVLRLLAEDESLLVVCTVATHPALPSALAEALAGHESPLVRRSLGSNVSLSPRLAERLRADPDPDVRRSLEMARLWRGR
jgi:hypothetical protein